MFIEYTAECLLKGETGVSPLALPACMEKDLA